MTLVLNGKLKWKVNILEKTVHCYRCTLETMAKHKYFDEDDKLWSGPKTPTVFNPNISLGHSLLWCMNNNPKKIIQVKSLLSQ